jgi:bifunctional DNase/RNase
MLSLWEAAMKRISPFAAVLLMIGLLAAPAYAGPEKGGKKTSLKPPKGFVEMTVARVMEYRGSQAVVLKTLSGDYTLEIWIGPSEAFVIGLRLNRQRFQRPLTHDLLDNIMHELGGKLVKIQVDDLKNNTFVGTVFVKHNKRLIPIDARPSDSIALAIGNRAPIFVSRKVLERAGRKETGKPAKDQETQDPEKLLKDILESEREEQTL